MYSFCLIYDDIVLSISVLLHGIIESTLPLHDFQRRPPITSFFLVCVAHVSPRGRVFTAFGLKASLMRAKYAARLYRIFQLIARICFPSSIFSVDSHAASAKTVRELKKYRVDSEETIRRSPSYENPNLKKRIDIMLKTLAKTQTERAFSCMLLGWVLIFNNKKERRPRAQYNFFCRYSQNTSLVQCKRQARLEVSSCGIDRTHSSQICSGN